MGNYIDIRYVLFSFLLDCPQEVRKIKIKELKNMNKKDYDEFEYWAKETIQIGEKDLGQKFDDDFKQLFFK